MFADKQMAFEVFEVRDDVNDIGQPDIIDAFLAANGGDYRAAMHELLKDADFLRDQLATAHRLMSHGYSRGWKPKYERL